ncbi:oligosaccharide flippase family protein, partial [bacterium]|nr:oligosaccharide flippase family protein [bacterium]MBU1024755.1 oligosaccharide flippase family protein [bacterium]
METKDVAKRSSQYFFAKIYATAMHVAGNFAIAKLFTVAGYGAYGFLFLILTYGASLHFGLENAFGKQYPVEIGKGSKSRADKIRDSSFTFSMMITLVFMLLIILFAVFYPSAEFEKRWAYILLAFTLPLQMLVEYYRTFFRVTKEFGRINVMEIIFGTFEFILRVAPVYYFVKISPRVEYALIGLFVGLFLTFFATILYAYFCAPEKISIRWNIPEVKKLYRLGIPIFICFLMDSLFKNGDKFMAFWFF